MADKELSSITAAGTLDGTETVHVVQSGNSRRATAKDIAQSAIVVETYGLSDVSSGAIDIDISDCNFVDIIVEDWTFAVADSLSVRFSTDGGSTVETGTVYYFAIPSNNSDNTQDRHPASPGSATSHQGFIVVKGHGLAIPTLIDCNFSDGTNAERRSGFVETTDIYDTLRLYGFDAETSNSVSITVLKY